MSLAMDVEKREGELGFPYWTPARRKFDLDSPFFYHGNLERELLGKQVALELSEDEKHEFQNFVGKEDSVVFCPIVGCGARLSSVETFEDHYNARHTASCSACSRVFPTSRLLSIHISESHDSFFKAKVARGYVMYECLVESCGLKFKSYKFRHQHLVDKHKFPTSFEFFKKGRASKKQRQKNQRKQNAHKGEEEATLEVEDGTTASKKQRQKNQRKQNVHKSEEEATMEVEDGTTASKKQRQKNQRKQNVHKGEEEATMEVEDGTTASNKQRQKNQTKQSVHKGEEEAAMEVEDATTMDGLVSAVSKLSTSDSTPSSVSFGRRHTRGLAFVPRAVHRGPKQE